MDFDLRFIQEAHAACTHLNAKEGAHPPGFELQRKDHPRDAELAIGNLLQHLDSNGYKVPFPQAWKDAVTDEGLVELTCVVAAFPVNASHPFANPDGKRLAGSMKCLAGILGALGVHKQPFLFVDVHPRADKWNAGMEGGTALDEDLIASTCDLLLQIPFARPLLVFGAHARDGLIIASGGHVKVPDWGKKEASYLAHGNGALFFRHPVCVHPWTGRERAIFEGKLMDARARKGGGFLAYSIEGLALWEAEQLQGNAFEDVLGLAILLRWEEKECEQDAFPPPLPPCLLYAIEQELDAIEARMKKEPGCSHLRALLSVWGSRGANAEVLDPVTGKMERRCVLNANAMVLDPVTGKMERRCVLMGRKSALKRKLAAKKANSKWITSLSSFLFPLDRIAWVTQCIYAGWEHARKRKAGKNGRKVGRKVGRPRLQFAPAKENKGKHQRKRKAAKEASSTCITSPSPLDRIEWVTQSIYAGWEHAWKKKAAVEANSNI